MKSIDENYEKIIDEFLTGKNDGFKIIPKEKLKESINKINEEMEAFNIEFQKSQIKAQIDASNLYITF